MSLVHTFDRAFLEHINVLCTWCLITDYPRVVTSMREGKGWTLLTVNFHQPSHEFTFNVGIDLLF
jgi:hypothetical protein